MTNFTKNLMVAAAALTLTAGVVSAQTLKAEIPFAFEVSGKVLPAGAYQVGNLSRNGTPVYTFRDASGNSAMALPAGAHDVNREWQSDTRPRLAFWCGSNRCALAEVWSGGQSPAYQMNRPKTVDIQTKIAVIVMRADKSD